MTFLQKIKSFSNRHKILLCLILIFLAFRLHHFSYPILDAHFFRQTQTATFALNFYKQGTNLFKTELDIFGVGQEKFLTLEFPLYEAIVAIFYQMFFVSDIWGRAVSISAGFIGAWYLFKLTALLTHSQKTAILAAFFYLAAPLNMFYQRAFMIEPTVVALLISALYYFCHFVNFNDKKSYLLSIILLSIGFMHKGIYGPFWLLPIIIYFAKRRALKKLYSLKFLSIIIIPLAALFLWQKHVDYVNTQNNHSYFTSFNKGQLEWNFGSLSDRFSLTLWASYGKQLMNGILLKPGLVIFIVGLTAVLKIDGNGFLIAWLLSQFIYLVIFFKIQSHNYYQIIMTPVFSVYMSIGLMKISGWVKDANLKIVFITVFCIIFIYKSWVNTLPSFYIDWEWYGRLKAVGDAVAKEAVGILATPGFDWNSVYTYIPRRKLLAVEVEKISPENLSNWKNLGYSFIVLHEYEKYPSYLEKVDPGFSLDFLNAKELLLDIEEFKVYQI